MGNNQRVDFTKNEIRFGGKSSLISLEFSRSKTPMQDGKLEIALNKMLLEGQNCWLRS